MRAGKESQIPAENIEYRNANDDGCTNFKRVPNAGMSRLLHIHELSIFLGTDHEVGPCSSEFGGHAAPGGKPVCATMHW